jgi:hypothetical protein
MPSTGFGNAMGSIMNLGMDYASLGGGPPLPPTNQTPSKITKPFGTVSSTNLSKPAVSTNNTGLT